MPDAYGNFKGMTVPAAAWDRIFGGKQEQVEQASAFGATVTVTVRPNRDNDADAR